MEATADYSFPDFHSLFLVLVTSNSSLAYEQALWGSLAAGQEKEGELATTSLEFEYLEQKSRCEMMIGGNGIGNDVITLGTCFWMFVYNVRFRFTVIGGNRPIRLTQCCTQIKSPGIRFFVYCICFIMWHSHLNDMEIPETKRFIPKGFELGTTLS